MSDEITGCGDDGSPVADALARLTAQIRSECNAELREIKQRVERLAFRFEKHEYSDHQADCMQKVCYCPEMAAEIRKLLTPLPTIEEMSGSIHFGDVDYNDL